MATSTPNPALQPLGRHEDRFWTRDTSTPIEHRAAGAYRVFIPDPIVGRDFGLGGTAVKALVEATGALASLQAARPELTSLAALALNLLRSESAASSSIEGIQISQRRLARAAYARTRGRGGDNRAAEVLGNIEAMQRAIEIGSNPRALNLEDVLDIHTTLLRFTEDREIAGTLRTRQNWIGGNDWHPIGATYVPPPPELVEGLLADLCTFANRSDVAPVAQAAIVHAQFENIHPFADGNGRVGRALIYAVLRHRGEVPNYLPPISLALAAQPKSYVTGLGAYSTGRVSSWCERFAQATTRAALEAQAVASAIDACQAAWIELLGRPRADAAVRQIIAALPGAPIIDVPAGQQLTGKSHVAVGNAIEQLERAGILHRLSERKWGRVWECAELLQLVDEVERRIATPS